ncbi:MAG: hypothetical protein IIB37_07800 [Gemmatimonadetes bacterium]|nr:hypothetical protein [Gemmatimonadota bacterium]MCH7935218.1 hypothetical protein [Gemmatimonadota bacterium]
MTPAYTHWQANAIRWQANATGGGRILLSGARIMIEHRSHQTAPPLPFGILLCLLLTLVPNIRATAQDIDDEWTVTPEEIAAAWSAPLFQTDDVLELTLYADFNTIRRRDRERDAEERQASILVDAEGSEVTLDLKIRTRGNWRLNPRNCEFPPLWLDFDKDDEALAGTVFEGQNRLKLYVTCRPGNDRYEEYIYTEYVIYPAYNVLTDLSFRARPVRVTYVDTSGEDDTFTSNAFLLEHKSQMAARNEAVPIELTQLHPANAHQENSALLELFNYAVGMTDYTCAGPPLHNCEPIRRMTDGALIPVSYDFDWSGTVDTRYATPDPSLPIRNVRQRIFQGFCRDIDYGSIFQRFTDKREEMLSVARNFEGLDEDRRDDIIEYWEDFFEMAADEGRHDRILRDCQSW